MNLFRKIYPHSNHATGFTLTEVAFSLGIIVSTVTVLLVLIGNALRQAQFTRDQLLGAAIAARVAESFATGGDVVFNGHALGDGEANIAPRGPVMPLVLDRVGANSTPSRPVQSAVTGRTAHDLVRNNPIYGVAGQFDLEHRLVGPNGFLRPVPLAIANRIDSPGNVIRRHLAEGGQIYYVAADALDGGNTDPGSLADSSLKDDLGRLLVAFIGPAQQNILPYHPTQLPPQRLYPFAPALGSPNIQDRVNERAYGNIPRSWEFRLAEPRMIRVDSDTDWSGYSGVIEYPHPEWYPQTEESRQTFTFDWEIYNPRDLGDPDRAGGSGLNGPGDPTRIRRAFIEAPMGSGGHRDAGEPNIRGGHDWRVWHWFATTEDADGGNTGLRWEHDPSGDWQAIWVDHVGDFAELTIDYFQRLLHQIDNIVITSEEELEDPEPYWEWRTRRIPADPPTIEETITVERRVRLPGGNWVTQEVERTITVPQFETERYQVLVYPEASGTNQMHRGIPAPPAGSLDAMVAYEDYWPGRMVLEFPGENGDESEWRLLTAASQVRTGLPGLEQRQKFRDRAQEMYNSIANAWGKNSAQNPLTSTFSRPGESGAIDPHDIHPAQILALNYVAYAAIMVTGYKPPFQARFNVPDSSTWVDLSAQEDDEGNPLPYREWHRNGDGEDIFFQYGTYRILGKDDDGENKESDWKGLSLFAQKPNPGFMADKSVQNLISQEALPADADILPPDIDIQAIDADRPVSAPAVYILAKAGTDNLEDIEDIEKRIEDGDLAQTWNGGALYFAAEGEADPTENWEKKITIEFAESDGETREVRRIVEYQINIAGEVDDPVWEAVGEPVEIRWSSPEVRLYYGPVLNPFPPPYADNDDQLMAQRAMYNLITYLNAYIAVNPHCHIVPKPLNRQTSWDQGLYAKDPLFGTHSNDFNDAGGSGYQQSYQDSLGMMMWGNHDAFFIPERFSHFTHPEHGWYNGRGEAEEAMVRMLISGRGASLYSFSGSDSGSRPHRNQVGMEAIRKTRSRGELSGRWWFTQPFEVADRTRQMVVWSAPWQSYQDFESALSAPVDFSHLTAQYRPGSGNSVRQHAGRYNPITNQYGHPEERIAFANPARDASIYRQPPERMMLEDGTDARGFAGGDGVEWDVGFNNINYNPGRDWHRRMIWAAMGLWGADRNGNGQFDRGPLPTNQRIRANEVGRYVVYDPVMWVPTR